jgi:hypothetical protein
MSLLKTEDESKYPALLELLKDAIGFAHRSSDGTQKQKDRSAAAAQVRRLQSRFG